MNNKSRLYEAFQILIKGQTPSQDTAYDDAVPLIGTELEPNEVLDLINEIKNVSTDRNKRLEEYEYMSKDGILGSVLELISDEASVVDGITNMAYWVESPNKKFETYINNWLRTNIKVNTFVWKLAYQFGKFGEVYLRTYNTKPSNMFKVGDFFELVPPQSTQHLQLYGNTLGFLHEEPRRTNPGSTVYQPSEFIHVYRDLGESEYIQAEYTHDNQLQESIVQIVYGTSFLESSRQAFYVLDLLDTMLLASRINKTQLTRLIKTEVGASSPKETRRIIQEVKNAFRIQSFDLNNHYQSSSKTIPINQVYIPIRNGKGDTNVEEFGGDSNVRDIADIEYYTDKLIASTRVPKAFLGLDSSLTAGLGQNSLTRVDIRYARLIKHIKSLVSETIYQMVKFKASKTPFSKDSFVIQTVPVSTAEENELYQVYGDKMNFISQLQQLLADNEHVSSDHFLDYCLSNILNLVDYDKFFNIKKESNDPIEVPNKEVNNDKTDS